MTEKWPVADLGIATIDHDPSKVAERAGAVDWSAVLRHRDPPRSSDAGREPEGTRPVPAEERHRSVNPEVTSDLRGRCPVCDQPYRPGEGVLGLAWLASAPGAVPSGPAAAGGEPGETVVLGHHRCVLPRLLTLLAGFRPAARFVTALADLPAGPSARPESPHDEF